MKTEMEGKIRLDSEEKLGAGERPTVFGLCLQGDVRFAHRLSRNSDSCIFITGR